MKNFAIVLTYFRPNGAPALRWHGEWVLREDPSQPGEFPMRYALAKLRGLRDAGGPGALPGVAGEGWNGAILIESGGGLHYRLLLPA